MYSGQCTLKGWPWSASCYLSRRGGRGPWFSWWWKLICYNLLACVHSIWLKRKLCTQHSILPCSASWQDSLLVLIACSFVFRWRRPDNVVSAESASLVAPGPSPPPIRLHSLAESIPWNRFLSSLSVYKFEVWRAVTTTLFIFGSLSP